MKWYLVAPVYGDVKECASIKELESELQDIMDNYGEESFDECTVIKGKPVEVTAKVQVKDT